MPAIIEARESTVLTGTGIVFALSSTCRMIDASKSLRVIDGH
jgi:hypothetical protein